MSINYKLIGRRVKEIRVMNLMTQADLAEQIDMSVPYISLIETGGKHASLTVLVRIANSLSVTVDVLLNGNQKNDPEEYFFEFIGLIADCDSNEKRYVYEVALAAKKSLRDYLWLQSNYE